MDTGLSTPVITPLEVILSLIPRCFPPHGGSEAYCSPFWKRVFFETYGRYPASHSDPLWDDLLHERRGLTLLHDVERKRYDTWGR